ncbi:MAG: hypothetical protein RLZZ385_1315 [Pseudomonadota bacterium]
MKQDCSASPTAAGQSEPAAEPAARSPDHVDAINQLFAEFALAYHNQFRKAYPDEESLVLAKKYWLGCLAPYSPLQITRAARQVVRSSDYLPSVAAVVRACDSGFALFGLPEPRAAYVEACRAPAPKAEWPWSHPAVYHAGVASDWYVLASEPEAVAFPIFAYHYELLCRRAMHGEDLGRPTPQALPARTRRKLSAAEKQERMRKLRQELDIQGNR